ncbi:MAG: class I SAM-dependent methyltransferase [Acidobacteriota bacterium]
MDDYELLIDLHRHGNRQGPGGDAETLLAMSLAKIDPEKPLKMADIGCGTGASTVLLAQQSQASIAAIDLLPDFLDVLDERAQRAGVADRISTLACSMDSLPFADGELDVIWSEGAIYSIGFEKGVSSWRRHLKPGGLLVASEITWLTESRPPELEAHWNAEYPEVDVASSKLAVLGKHGYSPVGYFALPEHCWLDQYYRPMQDRFGDFLHRNGHSEEAHRIVAAEQREIQLYESYRAYYSYGMYVARKL